MTRLIAIALLLTIFVLPARAEEPKLIKGFQHWSVFTFDESGHPVCYMAAQPQNPTA